MIYNFFRRYVQILVAMKRLDLTYLDKHYPKFLNENIFKIFDLNNQKALTSQDFLSNIKILMIYTKSSDMFLPIYLILFFRNFVRFRGMEKFISHKYPPEVEWDLLWDIEEDILYYLDPSGKEIDMLWFLDALPFEFRWNSSRKKYWFRYLRCNNELLLFLIFERSIFNFCLSKRLFRLILIFRLKLYYLFKAIFINKRDMCIFYHDYCAANKRLSSIFYKILKMLNKKGLPFLNKTLLFKESVFYLKTQLIIMKNNKFYNELYWFIYHFKYLDYWFLNMSNLTFTLDLYIDLILYTNITRTRFLKNPLKRFNKWLFFLSKLDFLRNLLKFNNFENPFIILYIFLFISPLVQINPKIIYKYHFWHLSKTLTIHEFLMFLLFRSLDTANDLKSYLIELIFIFRRLLFLILSKQSINLRSLNLILFKILYVLKRCKFYNFDKSGL